MKFGGYTKEETLRRVEKWEINTKNILHEQFLCYNKIAVDPSPQKKRIRETSFQRLTKYKPTK